MKVKVKQKLFRYKIKINIFMAENCHWKKNIMAENCHWKKISSWPRTAIAYRHALLKQSSKGNVVDWDEAKVSWPFVIYMYANMGDHVWKKFQTQMKEKRTKKKTNTDRGSGAGVILQREELIVQRLSVEVTGKAQKFSRIGPREFVQFADYEDITIANIKCACQKYFLPRVGKNVICDVLAGETRGHLVRLWSRFPT